MLGPPLNPNEHRLGPPHKTVGGEDDQRREPVMRSAVVTDLGLEII